MQDQGWLNRDFGQPADDVGAVLRVWRRAHSVSQETVAGVLDMSQQHLSLIETGKRPLSLEQRRLAVERLGIDPTELGLSDGAIRHARDQTDPEVSASQFRWRAQRRWLNQHRSDLAGMVATLYPPAWRVPGTTLIIHPGWHVPEPIPLMSLGLSLSDRRHPVGVTGSETESAAVRPLRTSGVRFDRYTSAVRQLDRPSLFESRPSYRILRVDPSSRTLEFGLAAYFDKLDVSETLGHETAIAAMDVDPDAASAIRDRLPFRGLVGDPFDPMRRAIIPAITTLTVRLRRYPAEPSFLLHWRDPAKVATAAGVYDVIPAGEFQPSSVALFDRDNDFDLWRNIVREYSEELLGAPEHDGTRTEPIDYDTWPLYQQLGDAITTGTATAYCLGLGLDALTLAATILTVVIIDDDVFERVFGAAVRYNDEGEIVGIGDGRPTEGLPFTDQSVQRMLGSEPMAAPGAACLALAWKHRRTLGL
jgi:transcriptional regulator with XRE-family HTH domain